MRRRRLTGNNEATTGGVVFKTVEQRAWEEAFATGWGLEDLQLQCPLNGDRAQKMAWLKQQIRDHEHCPGEQAFWAGWLARVSQQ